ncbi:MAG: hypothetical protein R3297_07225 [Desulfobulbales bacterium]|nr:hypothetical protein [Desulfobulbales bacterium]
MMGKKAYLQLVLFCAVIFTSALLTAFVHGAGAALVALETADCSKCHLDEPAAIAANGGKHQTAVTCLDCHQEHPPWGEEVVPECSMCHEGESHFELENCLACHSNPHEPLALNLADDITGPCLTCHEGPGKDFKEYASAHAEQSCTFCHEVHGEIPDCSNCHEPHAEGQVTSDCLGCHPAHHPLEINYAMTTPRAFCVPCHEEAGEKLEQTVTKHQAFTCAFCHRGQHPNVPACQTCHGEPHSPAMHQKIPECVECHMDPHLLVK